MTLIESVAEALLPGAPIDATDGTLHAMLGGIDRRARALRPDRPFTSWSVDDRERLLRDVLEEGSPASEDLRALLDTLAANRYSGTQAWQEVGFRPRTNLLASEPILRDGLPTVSLPAAADRYDVVVIGAGAGGGVAADVLTAAGLSVLLVERGAVFGAADLTVDHLRNARTHAGLPRQVDIGVESTPRLVEDEVVLPRSPLWNGNAAAVGGGTRVYGALGWRFCPEDFAMASVYGGDFVDWPITYADLAPYYDKIEQEIGVCGQEELMPWDGPRALSYPMPALLAPASRDILARGAANCGWRTGTPPMLINSVRRHGRGACIQCATCVGFGCPVDAKNGTHNTAVRRATDRGGCDLVERCVATRLLCDADGTVTAVELVWGTHRRTISARHVVVACGAIESARLLMTSGVGTEHDQVGRHLQGHLYRGATAEFDDEVEDCTGPGPSICVTEFRHHNKGVRGGGILARDFVPTPLEARQKLVQAGIISEIGHDAVVGFASAYRRTAYIVGPIQEVPQASSRVSLEPALRDRYGMPLARLTSPGAHVDDVATGDFIAERAAEWATASGARRVVTTSWALDKGPSADQHQAGTCRIGTDPRTSVCDVWGRVWGHRGVTVADGSLHVTNGGVNPVLTIMALATRVSEYLASDLN